MKNSNRKRWLLISDIQSPFELDGAIDFCRRVKKHYRIPDENILNIGDDCDLAFLSGYKRDVNAEFTARQEWDELREKMSAWAEAFPKMKLCESNHKDRWLKKAFDGEIPEFLIRDYKKAIGAPRGWVWRDHWLIKAKSPFIIQHGQGYSGINAHRQAAIDNGCSTAIGHIHSKAGISFIRTNGINIWGMNVGCLIDETRYAFKYSKNNRYKANLGIGVVLDDGKMPVFVPYGSL